MKKYFLFLVVPLFLLFFSCSGLLSTSRAGSITVRFNPSKLIASSNRAIAASDIPWSKAVFTITQEKEKTVTTIENKGSSELTFTHTAPIGTTVQIDIAIYQTIDGKEVVAYRGESQSITLTASDNEVVIRAVSQPAHITMSAEIIKGEPLKPTDWTKIQFDILQDGVKNSQTIENTGGTEPTYTHKAHIGTTVQITIAIYQNIDGKEVVAYRSESQSITLTASDNEVAIETVSQPAHITMSVEITEGEPLQSSDWTKIQFDILQGGVKNSQTIENTDDTEPTFTHTAPIGTTVQITIAIYQNIDGKEVVAYRGESQSITLTASTNKVVIQTVLQPADLTVSAEITKGEPLKPTDWTKIQFDILQDGVMNSQTIENTGGTEPTYTHKAHIGTTVLVNIAIYQNIDGIEVLAYRSESQITLAADTNKVVLQMQKMIYKFGDTGPAGGIIFYVNPTAAADGWTYLEAAPADLGTFKWDTVNSTTTDVITATDIGTGAANTKAIITTLGATGAAAIAADGYELGGKNDWFLPSKDELYKMYEARVEIGGFSEGYYWSSSQEQTLTAWDLKFINGDPYGNGKTNADSVRPIRAFNPPSF